MIGRRIGNYQITQGLGEGGVGEVFAAVDVMLNRPVAIKVLRPQLWQDAIVVSRFRDEAKSLARLSHPNITMLYSLHREGEALFMVMELVGGRTLEELLPATGQLDQREALAVTTQILDGLDYAHTAGIVHRDIKPANLMIAPSGLVKIMDFGIARARGSTRLTRQGHIVGTLAYMSPEQIKGEEGDERSDIYSLAVVLYEMLSGTPPFICKSEYELIRAQVEETPPRLRGRCPQLREQLEAALIRALAKSPADRFCSVADFALALELADVRAGATDLVARRFYPPAAYPTRLDVTVTAIPPEGGAAQRSPVAFTRLATADDPPLAGLTPGTGRRGQPGLGRRIVVPALVASVIGLGVLIGYAAFQWRGLAFPQPVPALLTGPERANSTTVGKNVHGVEPSSPPALSDMDAVKPAVATPLDVLSAGKGTAEEQPAGETIARGADASARGVAASPGGGTEKGFGGGAPERVAAPLPSLAPAVGPSSAPSPDMAGAAEDSAQEPASKAEKRMKKPARSQRSSTTRTESGWQIIRE